MATKVDCCAVKKVRRIVTFEDISYVFRLVLTLLHCMNSSKMQDERARQDQM